MQHKRGVRGGRPMGLHILLHRSWLPAGALMCAHLAVTVFGSYDLLPAVGLSVATAGAVAASLVAQEFAHAWSARRKGLRVVDVTVYPFGGVARYADEPDDPATEVVVALTGPLATGLLGGLCLAASLYTPGVAGDALRTVAVANFALGALNLIPGLPLDAGHIARAVLWARSGDKLRATQTAARVGQLAGAAMVVAGAALFMRDPSAPAGWTGLWTGVVGVFLTSLARGAGHAGGVVAAFEGRFAGDWARPFAGRVSIDDPIPAAEGLFAVSERGRLAGIASGDRAGSVARQAMVPWSSRLSCSASDPLTTALERMAATGTGAVVVLDEEGVVRGVLSEDGVRAHLRGGS